MSRTNFNLGRLAKDFLLRQLAPSPSGVASSSLGSSASLSPRLRAAAVVPLGNPGYFSFRFLPLVVLPETLSLLRFRLASRLGGSLPTRVLLEAQGLQLSLVMRGGIQFGSVNK
jgi:hypothetical protein